MELLVQEMAWQEFQNGETKFITKVALANHGPYNAAVIMWIILLKQQIVELYYIFVLILLTIGSMNKHFGDCCMIQKKLPLQYREINQVMVI